MWISILLVSWGKIYCLHEENYKHKHYKDINRKIKVKINPMTVVFGGSDAFLANRFSRNNFVWFLVLFSVNIRYSNDANDGYNNHRCKPHKPSAIRRYLWKYEFIGRKQKKMLNRIVMWLMGKGKLGLMCLSRSLCVFVCRNDIHSTDKNLSMHRILNWCSTFI